MYSKMNSPSLQFVFSPLLMMSIVAIAFNNLYSQTFYKTYGDAVVADRGMVIAKATDGSMFIGGSTNDSSLIIKLNAQGELIWGKSFKHVAQGLNIVKCLQVTVDGFLIGTSLGYTNSSPIYTGSSIFKFDLNGNLIWQRTEAAPIPYYFSKIIAISNAEYFVAGCKFQYNAGTHADYKFFKVDASTGNITSQSSIYDFDNGGLANYYDDISAVSQIDNNHVYVTGRVFAGANTNDKSRPAVAKVDLAGNIVWSKFLMKDNLASARILPTAISALNDTIIIAYHGDINGTSSIKTTGLIKMYQDGTVILTEDINIVSSGDDFCNTIAFVSDGYLLCGFTNYAGISGDVFIAKLNFDGTLQWTKSFGTANKEDVFTENFESFIVDEPNNAIFFTCNNSKGSSDVVVGRTDLNGNLSCVTNTLEATTITTLPNFEQATTHTSINDNLSLGVGVAMMSNDFPEECEDKLDLGNDTTLCLPFTFVLNANVPGGSAYLWNNGDTLPQISVADTGLYYVSVNLLCCVFTDSIYIGLTTLAVDTQFISICNGDSFVYNSHAYNSSGIYVDTIYNTIACDSVIYTNLTVNNLPTISYSGDTSICEGTSVLLDFTGALNYTWIPNTGISINTDSSFIVTPIAPTTYTVIGSDANNCVDSIGIPFTFKPTPVADFDFIITDNGCNYDVQFKDISTGNILTYFWEFGDLQDSYDANPKHVYNGGLYNVLLYVTNTSGCTDTSLQIVTLTPKQTFVFIPEAFTPNDDATNEFMEVYATCLIKVDFRIFNRWEQQIFETNKFPTKWSGEMYDGTIAPAGIYGYKLEATAVDGTKYEKVGTFVLIK